MYVVLLVSVQAHSIDTVGCLYLNVVVFSQLTAHLGDGVVKNPPGIVGTFAHQLNLP